MSQKNLCFYHANCWDGVGAAYLVGLMVEAVKEPIEFIPSIYEKTDLLEVLKLHSDVKKVFIVDFSFAPDQLINAALHYPQTDFLWVDHHEGAIKDWENWTQSTMSFLPPNIHPHLYLAKSGAGIVMSQVPYFLSKDTIDILSAIEDRDLWKFAMSDTKAICAGLRLYPVTVDGLHQAIKAGKNALIMMGESILEYDAQIIKEMLSRVTFIHNVGWINCPPHLASEMGNAIMHHYPDLSYAVCWYVIKEDEAKLSLRSVNSRENVMHIAKHWGGGGHRNAAGMSLRVEILSDFLSGLFTLHEIGGILNGDAS